MTTLASNQIRHLRAKAHALKPVVMLGANGLTANVLAEINGALDHHELIKVKVVAEDREQKAEFVETICAELQATKVQVLGHNLTLFRAKKKKSNYPLPKPNKAK